MSSVRTSAPAASARLRARRRQTRAPSRPRRREGRAPCLEEGGPRVAPLRAPCLGLVLIVSRRCSASSPSSARTSASASRSSSAAAAASSGTPAAAAAASRAVPRARAAGPAAPPCAPSASSLKPRLDRGRLPSPRASAASRRGGREVSRPPCVTRGPRLGCGSRGPGARQWPRSSRRERPERPSCRLYAGACAPRRPH